MVGNVVVVGRYGGPVRFDPSPGVDYRLPASGGGFVEKLSASGSRVWATPLGGTTVRSVALDASGNVYRWHVRPDLRPRVWTAGGHGRRWEDMFVATLSPAGAVDWAVTMGGDSSDLATGIAVSSDGTIFVAGYTSSSTVDYDPDPDDTHGLTNLACADMFLLKLRKR